MPKKTDPNTIEIDPETPTGNQDGDAGNTDWKAAYQGLQTKYNSLHKQAETWKTERDEAITNLTTTRTEAAQFQDNVNKLTEQLTGFETKMGDLEGKVAKSESQLARSKLIIEKFPDLAKFEAKGLLPAAKEDGDLETVFNIFRETLSENIQTKVDEALDGSTPPVKEQKTEDDLSTDALYQKMMENAGIDNEKYRHYQELYDKRTK